MSYWKRLINSNSTQEFINYFSYREKDKGIQFIISYKDSSAKWKQKSKQGFKTKMEAKIAADKALKKLKENLDLESNLDKEHEETTFKEFMDMFIKHENLYKEENTLNTYMTCSIAVSSLNEFQMINIKTSNIQKCIDELTEKGYKATTIKRYLSILHVIFKSAKDKYKIIIENPIVNIDMPKNKDDNEKRALTKKELSDLLSKIENIISCLY